MEQRRQLHVGHTAVGEGLFEPFPQGPLAFHLGEGLARREPRLYRLMFSEDIGRLLTGPELAFTEDLTQHEESIRLFAARLQLQELVEAVVGQGLREHAVRTAPGTDLERQVVIFWAMLHGTALLMLDGQLDIVLGGVSHEEAARLATEHLLIELAQSLLRSARAMALAKRAKGQVEARPEAREVEARGELGRLTYAHTERPDDLEARRAHGRERVVVRDLGLGRHRVAALDVLDAQLAHVGAHARRIGAGRADRCVARVAEAQRERVQQQTGR